MNYNKLIITFALLCANLSINAKASRANIKRPRVNVESVSPEKINHQVNMILEWAQSKTKEELDQIKDTIPFLNPRPSDTEIILEAKKIAKEKLFPTETNKTINTPEPIKGYWESYAPQFMQNAATSIKNYTTSWIPQSIKDLTKKEILIPLSVASGILLSEYVIRKMDAERRRQVKLLETKEKLNQELQQLKDKMNKPSTSLTHFLDTIKKKITSQQKQN